MGNHVFVVGNMSKPVKISDRSVIDDSKHLTNNAFCPVFGCTESLHSIEPHIDPFSCFQKSAIGGLRLG